ncbi:glycosyltransferase family 4 protein [Siccirubricoccus sp. KC 17139]|uniref:Glycosyltransferase family 4 protein n=2 Tax=Siccirubricoccus soli TaxID=2899147 RepID=A0ABT1D8Y4_9PROT|nr:glycosyltransferase family 4 protein [Siccirubricoccus soli]MCP2684541.1 glycosyltransferase family 4 protein [Siccirubricoccus soli]
MPWSRLVPRLFRRLRAARADAVHNHENLPLLGLALLLKAMRLGRLRVIHTVHVDPAQPKPFLKRVLIGLLFACCDQVVVVSEDTGRRIGNMAVPFRQNIRVIYGAPPPAAAPPAEALAEFARAHGLGPGPVICQITRFYYPLKVEGASQLLAAFRLVRQQVPEAQLLLVGHGPLWAEFRDRHGLSTPEPGVILTGFVDDPLVPMAAADVYCHVSRQDALPIVVMEAMALGKAVVASPVGGIPELIEHGESGVLAAPEAAGLARQLILLLRNPAQRAALGEAAAARIARSFTWTRCAAQYVAVYAPPPSLPRAAQASKQRVMPPPAA